ncbi:mas-related G-protein coupled receptor member A2-like [Tiliqua scincoides]|uniref:mas-related G-protein coupled receptor member A2-like n=1 Tax=Tiliqua scincoides TaxID=71010 RepID=UPI0034618CC5
MTNFSLTFPSLLVAEQENFPRFNSTVNSRKGLWYYYARDLGLTVNFSIICMVCIFGLVGNGAVIWLLGFRIKRNPFSTYILHLAVADFGVLLSIAGTYIAECSFTDMPRFHHCLIVAQSFSQFVYSASQFLLAAFSIDWCVSVLFPIWYRCHRPRNLSTIVCAFIWIVCFLVHGICAILKEVWALRYLFPVFYVLLVSVMVCLLLITVSSLILFIRFCFTSQLCKLLVAILLALFFFLILAFPFNVICIINVAKFNSDYEPVKLCRLVQYGLLCAFVNSFVNPLIYFLVGRKKRDLHQENMKLIVQRLFKEENISGEKIGSSEQFQI